MKKSLLAFAILLGSIYAPSMYAGCVSCARDLDTNNNGIYEEGEVCPDTQYQTGPCVCYCKVTKFQPCYYCVSHCVQEPYCVQKRCCRQVNQYYTKTHCRYVPQYYQKTYCKKVPEYYCVSETKYRTRTVKERKCKYKPYCYWTKRCIEAPACGSCPSGGCASGGCASGSCPAPSGDVQYYEPSSINSNGSMQNSDNMMNSGS